MCISAITIYTGSLDGLNGEFCPCDGEPDGDGDSGNCGSRLLNRL